MKSSDRTILVVVLVLGLVAAFWFMVLAPKREEASTLSDEVAALESEVTTAEASVSTASAAKSDFKSNYRQLVTLGKAVPVDADTPSLLTQLQTLSGRSDVTFKSITLGGGVSGAAPAAAPVTTSATPTEATASLLPIGASVGAAGLPIMPYTLEFQGGFFEIADFFGRIDDMVDAKDDSVSVNGRLLTIDSFAMTAGQEEGSAGLAVTVEATSYLSPADQGLTGGATESGPLLTAPVTEPSATEPVAPAVVGQ